MNRDRRPVRCVFIRGCYEHGIRDMTDLGTAKYTPIPLP